MTVAQHEINRNGLNHDMRKPSALQALYAVNPTNYGGFPSYRNSSVEPDASYHIRINELLNKLQSF